MGFCRSSVRITYYFRNLFENLFSCVWVSDNVILTYLDSILYFFIHKYVSYEDTKCYYQYKTFDVSCQDTLLDLYENLCLYEYIFIDIFSVQCYSKLVPIYERKWLKWQGTLNICESRRWIEILKICQSKKL